ncbi:MAG TPA: thiamine-phosphate kinase, partial [Vicinamibacterales bacterium]
GDDCAVIDAKRLAISTDMSVEEVHFRREWLEPARIGRRAAIAALSDLAAVAARPLGALVSLAMPGTDPPEVGAEIMAGLRDAIEHAGATLLGGDLTRSPAPIVIDVVVLGDVERPILRSGARPGDSLWVTGTLGGAESAVSDLLDGRTPDPAALLAFIAPTARIDEALWLAERDVLHAMIDLSDGLAGDAGHLAAASSARIIVDGPALPVHPAARAHGDDAALALALGGGDDYELCFAAAPHAVEALRDEFTRTFGVPLTRVGEVVEGSGVVLRDNDGRLRGMPVEGFSHFTRVAT